MADYYSLIAKAVEGLEKSTGEARRGLYDRARKALLEQLRGVEPALSEPDITRERLALEEAIRKVEAEAARRSRNDPPPLPRPEPPPPEVNTRTGRSYTMLLVNLHRHRSNFSWLRLGAPIFAGMLSLAGTWILTVEAFRPKLPFFSDDAADAKVAAANRDAARTAAAIGLVRGDLWTNYAMTLAPQIAGKSRSTSATAEPDPALDAARAAATRAVELAPHDSRIWLLLAAIDSRLARLDHNPLGPLKMSYYTGPNETALTPLRILIATRSDAITDPDLQILVGGELRTIIARKPDLKPFIVSAYRDALPRGKRFIEATVGVLDPALLTAIRATEQPQ
jgi:hypothetical protein